MPMTTTVDAPAYKGGDAVTIWELEVEDDIPVYYFKLEGEAMSEGERDGVLNYYRETIAMRQAFATLYDLSKGLPGFASHVVPFAGFCNSMRPITNGRLQFTIIVCPDAIYRGFMSMILKMAPSHAPVYVVSNINEAWDVLAHRGGGAAVPWNPSSAGAVLSAEEFCNREIDGGRGGF